MSDFRPNWKLPPEQALAIHIRTLIMRWGRSEKGSLASDDSWHGMCAELIKNINSDELADCKIIKKSDEHNREHNGET